MKRLLSLIARNTFYMVLVIITASLVEVLCLEFSWGFPVLSSSSARLVGNVSYAFLTSGIFFVVVVEIPRLRSKKINDQIAYRKIMNLLITGKLEIERITSIDGLLAAYPGWDTETVDCHDEAKLIEFIELQDPGSFETQVDESRDWVLRAVRACQTDRDYLDARTYKDLLTIEAIVDNLLVIEGEEAKSYATHVRVINDQLHKLYLQERRLLKRLFPSRNFDFLEDWEQRVPLVVPQQVPQQNP